MHISYLEDFPNLIPTLAEWHDSQWNYLNPSRTIQDRIAELAHHLQRRAIPTTFVAMENHKPIGCASLINHDMSTRLDLTPWLASVYVIPEARQHGVGSALVTRVVDEAKALKTPQLYLYTPDRAPFYARMGWELVEKVTYRGHPMDVMQIRLEPLLSA